MGPRTAVTPQDIHRRGESVLITGGPMGDADDEDEQRAALDLADEPVVAPPPAPEAMQLAAQGLAKAAGIAAGNAGLPVAAYSLLGGEIHARKLPAGRLGVIKDPARA